MKSLVFSLVFILLQSVAALSISPWSIWSHKFLVSDTSFIAWSISAEEAHFYSHIILFVGDIYTYNDFNVHKGESETTTISIGDEAFSFTGVPIILYDENSTQKFRILVENLNPFFSISDSEMRKLIEKVAETYLKENQTSKQANIKSKRFTR